VRSGASGASDFDAARFSEAINAQRAVATNGPFVRMTAHKLEAGQPVGADVEIGGTLATAGSGFELVVDVQGPEWMRFERLEILTHIPGGDVSCSVSTDPKANPKSRVACNGGANYNWPSEGIAASAALVAADHLKEKVAERDSATFSRTRVTRRFPFPAPAADTWYVAIAYGTGSMFPLVYAGVDGTTGRAGDATPFAVTNPILIDADGNGYDKFPGVGGGGGGGGGGQIPSAPRSAGRVTREEAVRLWERAQEQGPGPRPAQR